MLQIKRCWVLSGTDHSGGNVAFDVVQIPANIKKSALYLSHNALFRPSELAKWQR